MSTFLSLAVGVVLCMTDQHLMAGTQRCVAGPPQPFFSVSGDDTEKVTVADNGDVYTVTLYGPCALKKKKTQHEN
jgi:hypothetical protein